MRSFTALPLVMTMVGCGNTDPMPRTASNVEMLRDTPAAGPDDIAVAQVDSHPVWASCVKSQAESHHVTGRDALQQCIDFELLAQQAAQRGIGHAAELRQTRHEHMVSALVAQEFEQKFRTANDLPSSYVDGVLKKNQWRKDRADYRASFFIRFSVAATELRGSNADLAAKQKADALIVELGSLHGYVPSQIKQVAVGLFGPKGFEGSDVEMSDVGRLKLEYATPLFALADIGDVALPARTEWGWDVILMTSRLPPKITTDAELLTELFPPLRIFYFESWVAAIGKKLGIKPVIANNVEVLLDPSHDTQPGPAQP
jgi:hypothetical protein